MAKIDFSKIITKEELKDFDLELVKELNEEAFIHASYLNNHFPKEALIGMLEKRAREIAFLGKRYEDKSPIYKELLAVNITYNDDAKIIGHLLSNNIRYYDLRCYSNLISRMKKIRLENKPCFDVELTSHVDLSIRRLTAICNLFMKYYGYTDCDLIINKINDLVVFKKDLYMSMEKERAKAKIKTVK